MATPEIKIPNQTPFAQPQGPSLYDQLSLDGKAIVNIMMAQMEILKRIEARLAGVATPPAPAA